MSSSATKSCSLTAKISHLGEKDKKSSIVTLFFGPVKVGQGTLAGHWREDQVLRELRMNGSKAFKLVGDGETILKSQGIRVPVPPAPVTQEKANVVVTEN